tara:strand:+ start:49289 stop:49921 length:633 start_codon:yes stop_codon:yes gene_type:complete
LLATDASAGAWLRETGSSFTATSFSGSYFLDTSQSTYIEFGLRDNLTLGADINFYNSRLGQQSGHATLFVRMPIGATDSDNRWAYELGIGATWAGEFYYPHVRAGLSWGRSVKWNDHSGWMAVDASVRRDIGIDTTVTKIDSTIGIDFTPVTTGMLQLFVTHDPAGAKAKLAPSVVISPSFSKFRFQIGTETPLGSPRDTAIKIGLWRSF